MKFFLAISFFCSSLILSAQTNPPLHFEKVGGLSQNTVYSIMKDSQGFMWIATADGLNRYDGVGMKIFKPSIVYKKGEFAGRVIRTKLLEDEHDRIWFSSEDGLFCYNSKQNNFSDAKTETDGIHGLPWTLDPLLMEGSHLWVANGTIGIIDYDVE